MRRRGNRLFFCFLQSVQHLSFLEFWTGNLICRSVNQTFFRSKSNILDLTKKCEYFPDFPGFPGFETNIARNPGKRKLQTFPVKEGPFVKEKCFLSPRPSTASPANLLSTPTIFFPLYQVYNPNFHDSVTFVKNQIYLPFLIDFSFSMVTYKTSGFYGQFGTEKKICRATQQTMIGIDSDNLSNGKHQGIFGSSSFLLYKITLVYFEQQWLENEHWPLEKKKHNRFL